LTDLDGFREWLERWAPGAEWGVAFGTALLAAATFVLARRAHDEAKAVRAEASAVARQAELQAEQLVATHRPLVLPFMGGAIDAVPHLFIKNAGAGAAMNVRGAVYWTGTAGGASSLHPQVLSPGEDVPARVLGEGIVVNWTNAVGYLRYHDLSGTEWQTHFRFRVDGAGNVRVELLALGTTADFGEPAYNSEGWANRPDSVQLWQVEQ
jgi:hypothetical protein